MRAAATPTATPRSCSRSRRRARRPGSVELVQRPTIRTPIDEPQAGALIRLLDALEEHADVQAVHTNLKVDAEVLERVAAA